MGESPFGSCFAGSPVRFWVGLVPHEFDPRHHDLLYIWVTFHRYLRPATPSSVQIRLWRGRNRRDVHLSLLHEPAGRRTSFEVLHLDGVRLDPLAHDVKQEGPRSVRLEGSGTGV